MSGRLRRTREWLAANGSLTFNSADFKIGSLLGVGGGVAVGLSETVREAARAVAFMEATLGLAVLAVVLTALSVLVAFMSEEYMLFLRGTKRGVAGAIRPYRTIATVSGSATVIGTASALLWPALPWFHQALGIALATWVTVWGVLGTVQLVGITSWHGHMRSRMAEIPEAAREALLSKRDAANNP